MWSRLMVEVFVLTYAVRSRWSVTRVNPMGRQHP